MHRRDDCAGRICTERDAYREVARDAPAGARVPLEAAVPVADPYDAYRRVRGDGPAFFLETGGGRDGWGYFGVDPASFARWPPDAAGDAPDGAGGALDVLDALVADERVVRGDCSVPIPGGHFGWLSYDVARELESLPDSTANDRGLPRLQVGTYDLIAAWEAPFEAGGPLRVVCAPRVDDPDAAYDRARDRACSFAARLRGETPAAPGPPVTGADPTFESECGRAAFRDRVRAVAEYVRAGDTFQANVSHRLTAPAAVHPVALYAALREVNPAPYAGLVEFPGVDLVSASPELLLERDGDRLRTEPIAGTRPRGASPAADDEYEADLRGDEKERAEHAMLVDLERNDLGRVSAYGSVDVTDYRRVDRHPEVMHLVSEVCGTLRPGATLGEAVAAVFPGGTITGAPKPRTMEIIDEVEATRRGPYTGSVAAVGFDGRRAVLNILIRTLVRHADEYHLRVGAGIVADSDPDREYDETLDKARGLVNALDAAVGGTDLGVDGDG